MTPRARALAAVARARTLKAAPPGVVFLTEEDLAGTTSTTEPGPMVLQPPQEEQDDNPAVEAVVVALALYLVSPAAVAAKRLPASLTAQLARLGFAAVAIRTAARLALSIPLASDTRRRRTRYRGVTAAQRVAVNEPVLRARYLVGAARRLTAANEAGRFDPALESEKRYLAGHQEAGALRRAAAARYDAAAARSTTGYLIWRTKGDTRVTPDCRALEGQIFPRTDPPGIPGAQHIRCRCWVDPV